MAVLAVETSLQERRTFQEREFPAPISRMVRPGAPWRLSDFRNLLHHRSISHAVANPQPLIMEIAVPPSGMQARHRKTLGM